jgi:hypothetical protein
MTGNLATKWPSGPMPSGQVAPCQVAKWPKLSVFLASVLHQAALARAGGCAAGPTGGRAFRSLARSRTHSDSASPFNF